MQEKSSWANGVLSYSFKVFNFPSNVTAKIFTESLGAELNFCIRKDCFGSEKSKENIQLSYHRAETYIILTKYENGRT